MSKLAQQQKLAKTPYVFTFPDNTTYSVSITNVSNSFDGISERIPMRSVPSEPGSSELALLIKTIRLQGWKKPNVVIQGTTNSRVLSTWFRDAYASENPNEEDVTKRIYVNFKGIYRIQKVEFYYNNKREYFYIPEQQQQFYKIADAVNMREVDLRTLVNCVRNQQYQIPIIIIRDNNCAKAYDGLDYQQSKSNYDYPYILMTDGTVEIFKANEQQQDVCPNCGSDEQPIYGSARDLTNPENRCGTMVYCCPQCKYVYSSHF